jgi:hypothetical protein
MVEAEVLRPAAIDPVPQGRLQQRAGAEEVGADRDGWAVEDLDLLQGTVGTHDEVIEALEASGVDQRIDVDQRVPPRQSPGGRRRSR